MPSEALLILLRIRSLAVVEGKRLLADRLRAETAAEHEARNVEISIATETARASSLDGGDCVVEQYAAWLKHARVQLEQARKTRDDRSAMTAQARAALSIARASHEAIEATLNRQIEEEKADVERRLQLGLDEAALTAHRRNR